MASWHVNKFNFIGVLYHRLLNCLLNTLFRLTAMKISMLLITDHLVRGIHQWQVNPPRKRRKRPTGESPIESGKILSWQSKVINNIMFKFMVRPFTRIPDKRNYLVTCFVSVQSVLWNLAQSKKTCLLWGFGDCAWIHLILPPLTLGQTLQVLEAPKSDTLRHLQTSSLFRHRTWNISCLKLVVKTVIRADLSRIFFEIDEL